MATPRGQCGGGSAPPRPSLLLSRQNFYRKFLYEPFPVESSLHGVLHDHINAEVSGGTICSRQDAVDFLTWTFFFRRLLANPSYYGLEDSSAEGIHAFLVDLVDGVLTELQESGCLTIDSADGTDADDDGAATVYTAATPATEVMAAYTGAAGVEAARLRARVAPTVLGHVASAYYLHYRTVSLMEDSLEAGMREPALTRLLCDAHEFDELPGARAPAPLERTGPPRAPR